VQRDRALEGERPGPGASVAAGLSPKRERGKRRDEVSPDRSRSRACSSTRRSLALVQRVCARAVLAGAKRERGPPATEAEGTFSRILRSSAKTS